MRQLHVNLILMVLLIGTILCATRIVQASINRNVLVVSWNVQVVPANVL